MDVIQILLNKNINTPHIIACTFGFLFFILSWLILPYAVAGDQLVYIKFYLEAASLNFPDAYALFYTTLGSLEPGYFLLTYVSSHFVEKSILMSVLNALLGYFVVLWLCKKNVSMYVILILSLNFYLLVLFFSAERLKLAMLLFIVAISSSGWLRALAIVASITAHVQVLVLYILELTKNVKDFCAGLLLFSRVRKPSFIEFLLTCLILLTVVFLSAHIEQKLLYYFNHHEVGESIWKPLVFLLLTAFYAKGEVLSAGMKQVIIIFLVLLVGEERLVIFSYIIFMSYALKVNRGINVGVLVVSTYFFLKGVVFLYGIYLYGDGFSKVL